ncbi:rRNA pseudouridine synthase [Tahibacter amnicola]|uniref:Dual-specificity RNA pseudouridine synthase RluF n=1 Tax=Tahibacter amnicola TaxID=2976241 RepID=A0ABY6BJU5_9GAMM|nr:rRNA pseudouridine synthase [Tahibacter amnicola]UXI70294.1 rRNA pseudouridine synthase [Tahibacter amnicola]
MNEPVRLSKRLAALIGCSRSEAEQYIENGWVSVDGAVVEEPHYKVTDEIVSLDPAANLDAVQPATMLLNKPEGLSVDLALQQISLDSRSADDTSGIRALKRHFRKLTCPAGLESDSCGLVVLTQDWRVSRRLIEDTLTIEQEYVVEVSGEVIENGLALLNHGLSVGGWPVPPCKVSWQSENRLRFAIKAPQPGQLRAMCAQVGLTPLTIKRIRIGRISMGKMSVGQWRYLPVNERF